MQSRISLLRIAALALLVYALALFTSAVRDVSYARQRLASQEATLCAAQRENLGCAGPPFLRTQPAAAGCVRLFPFRCPAPEL